LAWLKETKLGRKIPTEPHDRALLGASVGSFVNLLYAVFHGAMGVLDRSYWFLFLCVYYAISGMMRCLLVLYARKYGAAGFQKRGHRVVRASGVLLILLSLCLGGVVDLSLARQSTAYPEIIMITIATYTFCGIGLAIARAVRARKMPSMLLAAYRSIGYANLAASVFTMQRSMLVSFEPMEATSMRLFNLLTGIAVCLFVFVCGIVLLRRPEQASQCNIGGE
jgi:hypothetical protein